MRRSKAEMNQILVRLLTPIQYSRCLFFWDRKRTLLDPRFCLERSVFALRDPSWENTPIDNPEKTSIIKRLDLLWLSPTNEGRCKAGRWIPKNTLICDSSFTSLRFNPKNNCLILPSDLTNAFDLIVERLDLITK